MDPLLAQVRLAVVRALAGPLARYLLHTGDLAGNPALAGLWRVSLGCLAAVLVVPLAVTGAAVLTGRPGPSVARRQLAAVLTAMLAVPATGLEVGLANALTGALLPPVAARGLWGRLAVVSGRPAPGDVAATVAGVLVVVLLFVVAVLALARWASLWLLVALAPIAMAAALLPGAERLPGTWWRLQVTAVFLPVGQAVALATYAALVGQAHDPLAGALAGVAVLALVAKLPRWAAGLAVGVELRDLGGRLLSRPVTGWAAGGRRAAGGPGGTGGTGGAGASAASGVGGAPLAPLGGG